MAKLRGNPWAVLVVLCMGFFMILLDTTIVNIAIPSIIDALHAGLDQILWVLNAYILVYAVLLITAGRLGDLYGQRNLFVIGLVIFTIASAACGFAQSPDQLIISRIVQGFGGALLTPQSLAIITTIFPAEKRGAAFGIWGGVAGLASIAGPTLGGYLVSNTGLSWRAIFFVNVPVGIAVFIAAFALLPSTRQGRQHSLDIVGVILASLGLFGVVFGLIEGQPYSWGAILGPISVYEIIAAGLLVLVGFVIWERNQREPLIPLALFQNRNFAVMSGVSAAVAFGMLGLFLPFVIYLQSVRGLTALEAGLTIVPMSLISLPVAPIAGRLTDRIGGKYILMTGLTLFAIGMGMLALISGLDTQWYEFLPAFIVAGAGLGLTFAPMTTVAMRNIQPQLAGAASGVLNTTRQLGGVLGSAVVGAFLQNRLALALHDEAITHSGSLPASFRQSFVDGFSRAASGGLEVGRGQSGAASRLPAGLPPAVAQQLAQVSHDVFVNAYLDALKPSLVIPVLVMVLGAAACGLIQRRKLAAEDAVRKGGQPITV